jgi:phosphinothricin acetyltransferase
LPVLVAVDAAGSILGWAALSTMRRMAGYRFTVETSVYVADGHRRQGIGSVLLGAVVAEARRLGMHAIVAWLDSAGEASLRLHSSAGFAEVGRLREVGRKFDRWLDVVLMELLLQPEERT